MAHGSGSRSEYDYLELYEDDETELHSSRENVGQADAAPINDELLAMIFANEIQQFHTRVTDIISDLINQGAALNTGRCLNDATESTADQSRAYYSDDDRSSNEDTESLDSDFQSKLALDSRSTPSEVSQSVHGNAGYSERLADSTEEKAPSTSKEGKKSGYPSVCPSCNPCRGARPKIRPVNKQPKQSSIPYKTLESSDDDGWQWYSGHDSDW